MSHKISLYANALTQYQICLRGNKKDDVMYHNYCIINIYHITLSYFISLIIKMKYMIASFDILRQLCKTLQYRYWLVGMMIVNLSATTERISFSDRAYGKSYY